MGRRALPKIDPQICLSDHLLSAEELPESLTTQALFGRTMPLEIEVGSGKGLFMLNASVANPLHAFVGIEIIHKYARFAASRLAKHGICNAKMINANGIDLFAKRIPSESVEAVHVYFPDPWWKKRHRRRRVMTEQFVADVFRALVPAGRLHFWTDVEEYFVSTLQMIAADFDFEGPIHVEEQAPLHDLDFRTHFERRVRQNDLPVHRAEFAKPSWRVECSTGLNTLTTNLESTPEPPTDS
jgi:tRNA (guanine-N7-)-methyltransferase